ncbi:MAG: isochorismatase family protein [Nitrospirota bacterium]|nr:isochorismatase family protein [Nitrospirota bacterium]
MKLSKQASSSDPQNTQTLTIPQPDEHSALLLVDLQNDFFPGGALAVPEADVLIPLINTYIKHFSRQGFAILATRDWHPANHTSFTEQQGPWPVHCVQGSRGAQFHSDLVMPPGMMVISKGTDPRKDEDPVLMEQAWPIGWKISMSKHCLFWGWLLRTASNRQSSMAVNAAYVSCC